MFPADIGSSHSSGNVSCGWGYIFPRRVLEAKMEAGAGVGVEVAREGLGRTCLRKRGGRISSTKATFWPAVSRWRCTFRPQ